MGAPSRYCAASVSARHLRKHSAGSWTAGIGHHRDGERARQRDPHRHTRPRGDDLPQRTCRRHRRHERAAWLVVRHFDDPDTERRVLARHARRRRPPRPGLACHSIHGRLTGSEGEQPARAGRRHCVDRHRQGRRALDGNGGQPIRHSGGADRSSGAGDDSRSFGQRVDRGGIGRTRARGRSRTREPLGVERLARPQRVVGVRGSRRQHLGRHGSRHRAVAGSAVHLVLHRAGPAAGGGRPRLCRRSRTSVVCAHERRVVLDRGRRGRPHDRGGPRSRRCVPRSPAQGTTCGSADSAAVSRACAAREADGQPCGSQTPTGFHRTASTP